MFDLSVELIEGWRNFIENYDAGKVFTVSTLLYSTVLKFPD